MREIRSVTDLDLRRNEETTEDSLRRAPGKAADNAHEGHQSQAAYSLPK